MRVIHASPPMGPSYGGPFQSVRKLAQCQTMAGVDAQVRMPWSAEAEAHIGDWAPAKVSIEGNICVSPLGWSPRYGRELLRHEADILHSHGLWLYPSWVALAWKKKFGKPHVASVRGMLEAWAWKHKTWKKQPVWWLWEERNLRTASLLHATSKQEAQSIRDRGLTAPIAIIANGVSLPFHLSENSGDPKVRLSGDPLSNRTALFVGRIHPVKGLPLLVEAWVKVRPRGWKMKIVGPDEAGHRAEVEAFIRKAGLEDEFEFIGSLKEEALHRVYQSVDLYIQPSHTENFGMAIAEAMTHGLPVITTHGTPWKLLEENYCGWWVPVSANGIASALDDATRRSSEELSAMGERGRKVVGTRFAWNGVAKQFAECYRWLLGKGEKPECIV